MKLSSSIQLLQRLTEMFIQFIPNPLQFIQQNEKLEGKILIKEIVICLSSLMKLIITSPMIIPLIKLSTTYIIECLKINSNNNVFYKNWNNSISITTIRKFT